MTKYTDLELFRDYFNNFLTVDAFAEHYGLTREKAETSIALGCNEHDAVAALDATYTDEFTCVWCETSACAHGDIMCTEREQMGL